MVSPVRPQNPKITVRLSPIEPFTLEQARHFIREDELVEVTPGSVRMRKAVLFARKRHTLRGCWVKKAAAA